MKASVVSSHSKVFSLGRKRSLAVRSCSVRSMSEATESSEVSTLRVCILRAYLRKAVHSVLVGILLKDFQIKRLSSEKTTTTNDSKGSLPSFQISWGKHLSSGVSRSCVPHNASKMGSQKPLRQHANATAVTFASDAMSSHARSPGYHPH